MTDNETRERVRLQAMSRNAYYPIRELAFDTIWEAAVGSFLIPADTAALITEARETQAFIDEREALKYGSVVGESNRLTERLADALESSSREVERLRMALKEKEQA